MQPIQKPTAHIVQNLALGARSTHHCAGKRLPASPVLLPLSSALSAVLSSHSAGSPDHSRPTFRPTHLLTQSHDSSPVTLACLSDHSRSPACLSTCLTMDGVVCIYSALSLLFLWLVAHTHTFISPSLIFSPAFSRNTIHISNLAVAHTVDDSGYCRPHYLFHYTCIGSAEGPRRSPTVVIQYLVSQ